MVDGIDWILIKKEYITTELGYRKLAEKHNVSMRTLSDRGKREHWPDQRLQYQHKAIKKAVDDVVRDDSKRLQRVVKLSDTAIDYVERAIDDLHKYMVKHKKTEKEIIYDERETKRVVKEIVTVTEDVEIVEGKIDAFQLNQITLALKNLKEVQMLRNDTDRREQEARIKKLEAEATKAAPEENDENTGVVLLADTIDIEEPLEAGGENE